MKAMKMRIAASALKEISRAFEDGTARGTASSTEDDTFRFVKFYPYFNGESGDSARKVHIEVKFSGF